MEELQLIEKKKEKKRKNSVISFCASFVLASTEYMG
jgi:hypothetical protein